MRRIAIAGAALLALTTLAGAQPRPAYTTGPHNIEIPAGWETRFIRYATVDNAERKIVRHIYVNPEAHGAMRPGEPLPYGTVLILADTRARVDAQGVPLRDLAGRMIPEPGWIGINMQQKERGWGEGYGPQQRNGEWEYAAFDGAGQRRAIPLNNCFGCHLGARAQQDFAFTAWDYAQVRR
jgi:hypothetical protein